MEPTLQVDEGPQPDQAAPAPGLLIVFVALAALVLASRRRS
jgi:MYXO-CTERM domain-containing protein